MPPSAPFQPCGPPLWRQGQACPRPPLSRYAGAIESIARTSEARWGDTPLHPLACDNRPTWHDAAGALRQGGRTQEAHACETRITLHNRLAAAVHNSNLAEIESCLAEGAHGWVELVVERNLRGNHLRAGITPHIFAALVNDLRTTCRPRANAAAACWEASLHAGPAYTRILFSYQVELSEAVIGKISRCRGAQWVPNLCAGVANAEVWSRFLLACATNYAAESFELLLAAHTDINRTDSQGNTLLHRLTWYAGTDSMAIPRVGQLLGRHPHVNTQNYQGETALHQAARGNHTYLVDLLSKHGALQLPNKRGIRPAELATSDRSREAGHCSPCLVKRMWQCLRRQNMAYLFPQQKPCYHPGR